MSVKVCKIKIGDSQFHFTLKRRQRMRYVRLHIRPNASLVVTAPSSYPLFLINHFVRSRLPWVEKYLSRQKGIFAQVHTKEEKKLIRSKTLALVKDRLVFFNKFYNFTYHRLSIRDAVSRWGSCSSRGSLNFNYRLSLLPTDLADYIIVHELCHLQEMNHSKNFWRLVAQSIPEYRDRIKDLKNI